MRSPGPANAGHEKLACGDCHRRAPGTIRQQLQANARWLIGLREKPVDFGLLAVDSSDCLDCHDRPTDRHPIYRFLEPRFAQVRDAIAPHRCLSCHAEHTGRRVTIENGFCRHCHADLRIPGDRIDPTHEALIAERHFSSCLQCHDFHDNHRHEPPRSLVEGIEADAIEAYLDGGPSTYTGPKRHSSSETRSTP